MAGVAPKRNVFLGEILLIQPLESQKNFTQPQISIKK
jgi:hypothetical protein